MWTAKNRQGFLGITCSFLDKNFTLHEIILTIEYVRYPHTSENISDTLFYILDEWDLREKVHIIVTDNGANIKKAIKDIGTISKNIKWQSCAAHTLQLIVGKELNLVKLLVLKAKRLIDFFLRPKQSERLEEIQKKSYHIIEVDTGETSDFLLHVIADISTRWNSSYYAWTRLVKVKGYIQALLPELENDSDQSAKKDGKYLRSIMLSLDEWDLLQELIIVLEQATRHLGGEKYVTYKNNNNQKKQNQIDLNQSLNTKDMLDKVKKNLYNAMYFYWQFLSEYYMISTILDPRIKCVNDELEKDEELLRQKYEHYYQDQLQTPIKSRSVSPISLEHLPTSQPSIFAIFEQNQPKVYDEIKKYLQEDKISFNQNPFEWWANKKIKYPISAKIARIYLVVPATSTPSERLFSDAGNLLTLPISI
ncbi:zinc finger BED domain-containing protein 1-like [Rhizophagus clarus]|uniref:Zinc finger BED domain-containing protein 1-like n=1 Tax=Rhizophagus clarus TaxID=94130 RepID=A0A8H3L1W3_9GLOM|nr:zinc finger BED domain-containing protein 1-like [Rhizophagus clarus]